MNAKLVIFDFDGTIADTKKTIILAKQECMRRLGLEVKSDEECASTIGLTSAKGFEMLYSDLSDEKLAECVSTYRECFENFRISDPPSVFPYVKETLTELKNRGIMRSIATSRNNPSLKGFLKGWGMDELFPYTLGADDTERLKPYPDQVLKTLKDLGVKADDTLVVGDMSFDIEMGKSAGVHTCGVTYGVGKRETLQDAGAEYLIDDIRDLLNIVGNQ